MSQVYENNKENVHQPEHKTYKTYKTYNPVKKSVYKPVYRKKCPPMYLWVLCMEVEGNNPCTLCTVAQFVRDARENLLKQLKNESLRIHIFPKSRIWGCGDINGKKVRGPAEDPSESPALYANVEECIMNAWIQPYALDRAFAFTASG
jgi:hypothetical protein